MRLGRHGRRLRAPRHATLHRPAPHPRVLPARRDAGPAVRPGPTHARAHPPGDAPTEPPASGRARRGRLVAPGRGATWRPPSRRSRSGSSGGIFSLLTASGGITRASFDERVARLFRGPETPEADLVEACLASYRSAEPSSDGLSGPASRSRTAMPSMGDGRHAHGVRPSPRHAHLDRPARAAAHLPGQPRSRPLSAIPSSASTCRSSRPARRRPSTRSTTSGMCAAAAPSCSTSSGWPASTSHSSGVVRASRRTTPSSASSSCPMSASRSSACASSARRSCARRLAEDNWHILKWSSVRRLHATKRASLAALAPLLGLDPRSVEARTRWPCSPPARSPEAQPEVARV